MKLTLNEQQLDQINTLVRQVTIAALPEQTRHLIKALVRAGHTSHAIAANFAAEGASVCTVNAVRWYAEEVEGCLLFDLVEDAK